MCLYKVKELESVKQPKDVVQFYPTPPGGGGYSHTLAIRVCAAGEDMVSSHLVW